MIGCEREWCVSVRAKIRRGGYEVGCRMRDRGRSGSERRWWRTVCASPAVRVSPESRGSKRNLPIRLSILAKLKANPNEIRTQRTRKKCKKIVLTLPALLSPAK